jgi:hypothetical protein
MAPERLYLTCFLAHALEHFLVVLEQEQRHAFVQTLGQTVAAAA